MRYLFFILLISLLTCCKQEKNSASSFEFYPPIPDSINSTDINKRLNLWKTWYTDQFNLSPLYSGTNDSLIIRFWPWYAFEKWTNMFEFRLDSSGWKGHHYCLKSDYESDMRIEDHKIPADSVFFVKRIIPKCGWDKFYDSLNFFELRSLPTESLIKDFNYKRMLDGYSYRFEIATKNSYRSIQYANPGAYTHKECKQIREIADVIARQVGDDYCWPWE
jgi:hypothetical protein